MGRNNTNTKSQKGKGEPNKAKFSSSHKKEITFDPNKRLEYLTGFSTRKKERRAFGLAMQKVKDRQAKIEERKDNREAQREKVEEIERSKAALRRGDDDDGQNDSGELDEGESKPCHKNEHTFQDEHTQNHFGGLVSVTTTYGILSDDEDSNDVKRTFFEREKHGKDHIDTAQRNAGNVQNYIAQVKGTMGGKKKKSGGRHNAGKKGQHGAATMKGMGGGTTLKMAKKTLAKFKAKGGEERDGGKGKGKKRKGGRR
jgi:ribosomal RNA-processing protein 17